MPKTPPNIDRLVQQISEEKRRIRDRLQDPKPTGGTAQTGKIAAAFRAVYGDAPTAE